MTVYGLIELMTRSCGSSASFGDVHLWWSDSKGVLTLSKRQPSPDAECLDNASLNKKPAVYSPAVSSERTP